MAVFEPFNSELFNSELFNSQSVMPAMKHMTTPQAGELLSALADGHLTSAECIETLNACKRDPSMLVNWNAYHLVGDLLRSSAPGLAQCADMAFVDRLQQRIASEAKPAGKALRSDSAFLSQFSEQRIVLAPPKMPVPPRNAANDENFRWKMVAGFASIAAVCAVTWSTFGSLSRTDVPQLALDLSKEQVIVPSPIGPMVRDVRLEELLADHRQLGSAATLQMPSEFFRNAAFEATKNGGR